MARDTLTKVQRPYVFVFGVNKIAMNNLMALGISPFVNYVVANYRREPLLLLRMWEPVSMKENFPTSL